MYKVKYGLVPDNVSNLFVRKDSAHSFRNNDYYSIVIVYFFCTFIEGVDFIVNNPL